MSLIIMIATCPFLIIANAKRHEEEKYYLLKLVGIWLLCLIYITLNNTYKIPIGIICASLIVLRANFNKFPKLIALLTGTIGLSVSSVIFLLYAK